MRGAPADETHTLQGLLLFEPAILSVHAFLCEKQKREPLESSRKWHDYFLRQSRGRSEGSSRTALSLGFEGFEPGVDDYTLDILVRWIRQRQSIAKIISRARVGTHLTRAESQDGLQRNCPPRTLREAQVFRDGQPLLTT
jgi:hypothetical protein